MQSTKYRRCSKNELFAEQQSSSQLYFLCTEPLPGFETIGCAYQLHSPCSRRDLTWLRHQIYRLVRRGRVEKRREKIPDLRQARGWDWGSRLYPVERKGD